MCEHSVGRCRQALTRCMGFCEIYLGKQKSPPNHSLKIHRNFIMAEFYLPNKLHKTHLLSGYKQTPLRILTDENKIKQLQLVTLK